MSSAETAYLFRHATVRDAAYQLQLPATRAKLHALALELLEASNGHPAELAAHAQAAQGDTELEGTMQEQELHWRRQAARRAMAEWQMDEAVAHIRRGLELPCVTDQIRVAGLISITVAMMTLGEYRRARAEVAPAMSICRRLGDTEGVQKVLFNAALIHLMLGEYEQAAVFNDELLELTADEPETVQRAMAVKQRGVLRKFLGDLTGAEQAFAEALEIATGAGNPRETAGVLLDRGIARIEGGNLDGADVDLDTALELLKDQDDPLRKSILLRNRSDLRLKQGQPRAALAEAAAAENVAREARLHELLAQALEARARACEALHEAEAAAAARVKAAAVRAERA